MPLGENKHSELLAATGGKATVAMDARPNLQPPPHFDLNPAAWQRWRQQFDDYSFATGLHAADEEIRVRTLLYSMGTRARDILLIFRASKQLSVLELGVVGSNSEERAKFVDVKVDGMSLHFKVDSSAEVTVVHSTFSGIPPYLKSPEWEFSGPAGQPLDVMGTFTATLQCKNESATQRLYVLRLQAMPLLGYPAIQELGVVNFVDPVDEMQGNQAASDKLFCGLDEYVRGLHFTIQTDHLPLTSSLGSIDVDALPPKIQRIRLKLMRYQYIVLYVPGKLLAIAETLSRAPVTSASPAEENQVELYVSEVVGNIVEGTPVCLIVVRQHHMMDGECVTLVRNPAKLSPDLARPDVVFEKDAAAKKRQTRDFNHRHRARELRCLSSGDEVWVTDVECRAQDFSRGQRPRSYIVETPSGVIQRN
ncbi:hypothetical protein MRX96_059037 [Rhipicephalus microplus]